MKQSDAIHAKVLQGAELVINGDDSSAGGSADIDYGHDLISEAFTEFEAAIIARLEASEDAQRSIASQMCYQREDEHLRGGSRHAFITTAGVRVDSCLQCRAYVGLVLLSVGKIIRAD